MAGNVGKMKDGLHETLNQLAGKPGIICDLGTVRVSSDILAAVCSSEAAGF
nr:hypothetical protein [Pantoea agglomerans]